MLHKNTNLKDPGKDNPQRAPSRTLIYPISIMPTFFIEVSSNLKHPKNVESINNTTSSYLVSFLVIPRSTAMKG